nr:hypothetical protein Itr_chr03CG22650 [Ipomoea trifida]
MHSPLTGDCNIRLELELGLVSTADDMSTPQSNDSIGKSKGMICIGEEECVSFAEVEGNGSEDSPMLDFISSGLLSSSITKLNTKFSSSIAAGNCMVPFFWVNVNVYNNNPKA